MQHISFKKMVDKHWQEKDCQHSQVFVIPILWLFIPLLTNTNLFVTAKLLEVVYIRCFPASQGLSCRIWAWRFSET
jgi:hypothetical protein